MATYSNYFLKAVLISFLFLSACTSSDKKRQNAEKPDENWIQLFNGKDLKNWQPKFTGYALGVNYKNTFEVKDGLLCVSYDNWDEWNGEFGHLFYKDEFSYYRLRVEYRFIGEQVKNAPGWAFRNNGLMLHGQTAESMELTQKFPASIEVQLLGGVSGKGERSTANLCTPGTNVLMNGELIEDHVVKSASETQYDDKWVSVEVEVHGGELIRHFVNGTEVLHYEKPQFDLRDTSYAKLFPVNASLVLTKGTISIQAESHPTEFRKIELLDLEE